MADAVGAAARHSILRRIVEAHVMAAERLHGARHDRAGAGARSRPDHRPESGDISFCALSTPFYLSPLLIRPPVPFTAFFFYHFSLLRAPKRGRQAVRGAGRTAAIFLTRAIGEARIRRRISRLTQASASGRL